MSNSIGTLTPSLIAQSGLAILAAKYPVIGDIVTDFSAAQYPFGTTVTTKIPTVGMLQNYTDASGYAPSSLNSTDVPVTLNNHIYSAFTLNDQELTQMPPLLFQSYAESFADAIGLGVMSGISSLFTTGNYTYSPTVQALTGVNRNTIIQAETQLNSRNVPKGGRYGVVNSNFYGQLLQDQSLVSTFFVPNGPGVAGPNVPVVNGINITEYSALPGGSGNAYLQGVIAARDAVAFVTRVPEDPGNQFPYAAQIDVVTDPISKLSVQTRFFYDPYKGKANVCYTLMYGVAVANPKSLQLITTQ